MAVSSLHTGNKLNPKSPYTLNPLHQLPKTHCRRPGSSPASTASLTKQAMVLPLRLPAGQAGGRCRQRQHGARPAELRAAEQPGSLRDLGGSEAEDAVLAHEGPLVPSPAEASMESSARETGLLTER